MALENSLRAFQKDIENLTSDEAAQFMLGLELLADAYALGLISETNGMPIKCYIGMAEQKVEESAPKRGDYTRLDIYKSLHLIEQMGYATTDGPQLYIKKKMMPLILSNCRPYVYEGIVPYN